METVRRTKVGGSTAIHDTLIVAVVVAVVVAVAVVVVVAVFMRPHVCRARTHGTTT